MRAPTPGAPHPPTFDLGLYVIDAEEHVTKEVRMHIIRSPSGEPLTYHLRLGTAIDDLANRGETRCILVADDWAVLLEFDQAGTRVPLPEDLPHG